MNYTKHITLVKLRIHLLWNYWSWTLPLLPLSVHRNDILAVVTNDVGVGGVSATTSYVVATNTVVAVHFAGVCCGCCFFFPFLGFAF
jgi:hypothetical protein